MLGKYPGRTIHVIGVALLGFWITAKAINGFLPEFNNLDLIKNLETQRDEESTGKETLNY